MPSGLFITGTDTGVGKTTVAAAIIRGLRARGIEAFGMKPIETGCARAGNLVKPSDGAFLKEAAGMDDSLEDITPYCFEAPAAPYLASEIEEKPIESDVIIEKFSRLSKKYSTGIVEGVGGLLVPLRRDYFVADLIKDLDLPVIVVSRPALGTLNHTLLTVNYAMKEAIRVSGIIINFSSPPDGTISEKAAHRMLEALSPAPVLGVFPYLQSSGRTPLRSLEEYGLRHLDFERIRRDAEG